MGSRSGMSSSAGEPSPLAELTTLPTNLSLLRDAPFRLLRAEEGKAEIDGVGGRMTVGEVEGVTTTEVAPGDKVR